MASALSYLRKTRLAAALLAVLVGVAMGGLAYLASTLEFKWAAMIVLAVAGIVLTLVVPDIHSLILLVLIVDMPLGVDIALDNQGWHRGGPTGYIISLMTIFMVVGYGLWLIERRPKLNFYAPVTVPAILYFSAILLSLFQSHNLKLSLFGVFLNLQFLLYYLYLANHVQRWENFRLVINAMAVFLLLESIYMMLQYFFGFSLTLGFIPAGQLTGSAGVSGTRVGGTIGSPNSAGVYLATMIGIVLSAYATGKWIHPKFAILACGAGFIALILTMTRTAWASLALIIGIMLPWIWRSSVRNRFFAVLVVAIIVAMLGFGSQIITRLQAAETDTARDELAYMAYNIIRAYPLGVGENNYDQVMSDRYAHPNWVGHTLYPAHNKFLLVWADDGLPGLVAFSILLLMAAWQAVRLAFRKGLDKNMAVLPAGLLAVLCGYILHMQSEGFSGRSNLQILWLIFALIMGVQPLLQALPPNKETPAESEQVTGVLWD